MNNQREFLQLQTNHIADVTFKFASGLKRDGQFGPYYLYTVSHEGKEKLLKVTEKLESKLRKLDIHAGQTVGLVKELVRPAKGEPFTVFNIVEANTPTPPRAVGTKPANTSATQTLPAVEGQVNFSGDKLVMYQSIVDAVDITKAIRGIDWRNNDIEKIGVSLFLSRTGQAKPELVHANGNGSEKKEDLPF